MRTLSARILLGFAALTVTFGVIIATVVYYMQRVGDQIVVMGKGYVPLALASKDLARRQEDLRNFLEDLPGESNVQVAKLALTRSRGSRDRALKSAHRILESVEERVAIAQQQFRVTRPTLDALDRAVHQLAPLYDQLIAAPPVGDAATWTDKQKAAADTLTRLKVEERRLLQKSNDLAEQLDRYVTTTTHRIEQNERSLRIITLSLGGAAVLLGLFITVWVVITLRPLRRLRDGARRIAAGDYASRIPEKGPAEVADLAREFNSMGRAVEERERELVRSERLAAVGKMAAMITHEVRNPLSSIGLNTELLEDELAEVPNAEEARGLCRSIHREVDRLTAITEEYLAFARLPKPKVAHEPINPIVGALASFVREDLAGKQVALSTELASDDPIGLMDAGQIRQCLINLVRNAADAVAAKGGGTVTLRTRRESARIAIEVEDDGVGIAPDLLPRLFDPFFSTKDGGSGLGLALTQQIVRDHGGELTVSSTVGRGTTFTLRVPAARA